MIDEKKRILIVEDNDVTLYKIKAFLIRLGYEVTAFNNPIEATKWLSSNVQKLDLIISDLEMPGMNGFEFIRNVRGHQETKRIPTILLTSRGDKDDKIEGLAAGADDYINKTVGIDELDLRVRALLARENTEQTTISRMTARSIAVFSLRGGVGVSSVSVNLSVAISQLLGIETYLWDMPSSIGQCALMMNLKPVSTIASICDWSDSSLDEATLRNIVLKHDTGVSLIPAPTSVEELELITPKIIDLVWMSVAPLVPYIIIDAGNHISEQSLTILARADNIILLMAPELASINAVNQAINLFSTLGFEREKIQLVINHISQVESFDREKISASLNKKILAEIPYDGRNMIKAINRGSPYLSIAPKTPTSLEIMKLAYRISAKEIQ